MVAIVPSRRKSRRCVTVCAEEAPCFDLKPKKNVARENLSIPSYKEAASGTPLSATPNT